MIRVLYTIPNLDTAGSGRALVNLVEHLDRSAFEPVVAVDRLAGNTLESRFEAVGVPVVPAAVRVASRPRRSLWARTRDVGRLRRDFDAAIWHSFHYLDDYTEPLVAHAAGAAWVYTKKNMSWNARSWKLRTGLADGVLAQNSDMLIRFFSSRRVRAKTWLVPRGVPSAAHPPVAAPSRAAFGLPAGGVMVTCVAHLQPRKRQHVLVEAMAAVPGAHLALAGADLNDYGSRVRQTAKRVGVVDRVHLLGTIEDVPGLLAVSDVFCLPTGDAAEGCPVALLEAMAAGLPVAVTDVPGSRDVVRPDRDGLVVAPDDPNALAAALRMLVNSPAERTRLAGAASERFRRDYTIEREAAQTEACYRAVLARRRRA
jgi:glycosyltransferase involved in cell wall biosynthesis